MNHGAVPSGVRVHTPVPASAGVGLKPRHYRTILETQPAIGWFEVHPENYMGDGGPPHWYLNAIRERYPLSLHGVGLSIGGDRPLDSDHLARLACLVQRYQPGLVSEHLAWSTHDAGYLNDLLPLPYTEETLARVAAHVTQVQDQLGRQLLLENPSTYVRFADSGIGEIQFLGELATRTGCGLLLDVNNVYVSAMNHGFDPGDYIDRFPMEHVGEIHLAGHDQQTDDRGEALLIDTHDRRVSHRVWTLFERTLRHCGPVPTLVEWDSHIPEWPVLFGEAQQAAALLGQYRNTRSPDHAGPC